MTDGTQMDIREICEELQQGPLLSAHRAKIEAVMRHFAKAGLTLATCADERHLGRALSTLKGYCRDFRLRFPDYVPWDMRTAEEKKRKKAAA